MFMLGKNPNVVVALFTAFIVSIGAAASEEVFFRGLVQNLFNQIIPAPASLLFTSVIFGIAHLPLNNINFILETILGGAFGLLYITSGYNLAVPVIAHVVYDFTTLLGSWIWGRNEIQRRIQQQNEQVQNIFKLSKEEFDKLSYAYFKALDLNNDGYISKDEFTVSYMMKPVDRMPLWSQWPAAYDEFKYKLHTVHTFPLSFGLTPLLFLYTI